MSNFSASSTDRSKPPRSKWHLFLLLFLLTTLSACSRTDGRTVIRFIDRPDRAGGWKELIERFEKANPDIDIVLEEDAADTDLRKQRYVTSLTAGDGEYDLVYMDVAWVPMFAASGWLRPLDDLFTPAEREKFLPGDIAGGTYDGKIYRVPLRSDAGLLYYRTDLVAKPPETFDELVELAKKYQKVPDLNGFVFQGMQYEGLVCNFLEILWGHGGDVDALNAPAAAQALTWMAGLVKTVSPEGVTTYQEEETRRDFQEGRAIFMRNWPYCWKLLNDGKSPVRGKVGVAPIPHAPGQMSAATLGGWGFGIAKTAKNPQAAWKFITFATAEEQQKLFHFKNGDIPSRRALYTDPEMLKANPHFPDLFKALLAARPRPVHPKYAQMSAAIQSAVSRALTGQQAPADALKEAAEKIRQVMAR